MSCFFFKFVAISFNSSHAGALDASTSAIAFVIFLLAESSLFVDIILEVKKSIAFVKKELVDETPLRTTGPLPFFALFERVVEDNDDDAPVVVIVDDEDEEAAVRFIFSTAFF